MPAGKPYEVVVDGRVRSVVLSKPKQWIEANPDGTHTLHYGRLLDAQPAIQMLADPKPCSVCKKPCLTATVRGRAHHPQCEGWLEQLPDQSAYAIAFAVAADLGARLRRFS